MDSLQGYFLLAAPDLLDPNFNKTVVLMVQHDDEGSLGVVLNRPTDKSVEDVWDQISEKTCVTTGALHIGGPLTGRLISIHSNPALSEIDVCPEVYFSTQKEQIEELAASDCQNLKFFLGYAGWAGGQLESELEIGSWSTIQANSERVFENDETLWDNVSNDVARSFIQRALKIQPPPGSQDAN